MVFAVVVDAAAAAASTVVCDPSQGSHIFITSFKVSRCPRAGEMTQCLKYLLLKREDLSSHP